MSQHDHLRADWQDTIMGEGGHCPVCDRWGKLNKFTLNQTLVRMLLAIYYRGSNEGDGDGWLDMPRLRDHLIHRTNQYSKLAYWNLIERHPTKSGLWRTTKLGEQFLKKSATVPAHVWVYNTAVHSVSQEQVYINEVFETGFDYESAMSDIFAYWEATGQTVRVSP